MKPLKPVLDSPDMCRWKCTFCETEFVYKMGRESKTCPVCREGTLIYMHTVINVVIDRSVLSDTET